MFGDYGSDLLIGGLGNDTFGLQLSQGLNIIADFQKGQDILGLSSGLTFDQLEIVGENSNTLIKIKATDVAIASLTGVNTSLIGMSDFQSL